MAAKAIDGGRITLNGARVKASREVRTGDILEMVTGNTRRRLEVLDIPSGQLSKVVSKDFYSVLSEERLTEDPW